MKKLMVAVALVCAATMANAASFAWDAPTDRLLDGTGGTTSAYRFNGNGYLFDAASVTQSALVQAITAGSVDETWLANNSISGSVGEFSGGRQEGTESFTYNVSASFSAYFAAIQDNGNVFISETTPSGYLAVGTQPISFEGYNEASKSTFAAGQTSYQGAGWYQSVPEPTSGLLLLLGMAGLALRRRRA